MRLRLSIALGLLLSTSVWAKKDPGYVSYLVGDSANVVRTPSGGLYLAGGGGDQDAGMKWMIDRSGGGDFLVLRASGGDAYNEYLYELGKVDSVQTIVITSRQGAVQPEVLKAVRNAEAIFLAGGDQGNYVRHWKGTELETAINDAARRGAPIGGTSAGLAVLGQFTYDALSGASAKSSKVLANPFHEDVSLTRNFLSMPNMKNVLTDSHFAARDRMGRLLVFLSRLVRDGWTKEARGMGVDEKTGLAVEPSGYASVIGSGYVYLIKTNTAPEVCAKNSPLTHSNFSVHRISRGDSFHLPTYTGKGGARYSLSIHSGSVSSSQSNSSIY